MPVTPSDRQHDILHLLSRGGPADLSAFHKKSVQVCWSRGWIAKHGPSAWFARRVRQAYHITDAGHEALARYRRAAGGEGNDAQATAPAHRT